MPSRRLFEVLFVFLLTLVTGVGTGLGLTAAQRHHELAAELDTGVPTACAALGNGGDGCKNALTSDAGKVLRIPIAIWGMSTQAAALCAALAFAVTTALGLWTQAAHVFGLLVVLAFISLGGTLTYLYIGLVQLSTKCTLCLFMHACNALYCILVGMAWTHYGDRLRDLQRRHGPGWKRQVEATVGLGAGVWFITAVAADFAYADKAMRLHRNRESNKPVHAMRGEVLTQCKSGRCLSPLVQPVSALPADSASLVLSRPQPGQPTLVEMLDVSCTHCRHDYKERMHHVLRKAVAGQVPYGVRLLLWPASTECNPNYGAEQPPHCEANAGLLCAHQLSPTVALDYLDEEVSHPNEQVFFDREAWLRQRGGEPAVQCFRDEKANNYGRLKQHAAAGLALRQRMAGQFPQCAQGFGSGDAKVDPARLFWCFTGTPAYGVFADGPAKPVPPDSELRAAVESPDKWQFLASCLAAP
jgi:uncharacterized membrane protein